MSQAERGESTPEYPRYWTNSIIFQTPDILDQLPPGATIYGRHLGLKAHNAHFYRPRYNNEVLRVHVSLQDSHVRRVPQRSPMTIVYRGIADQITWKSDHDRQVFISRDPNLEVTVLSYKTSGKYKYTDYLAFVNLLNID